MDKRDMSNIGKEIKDIIQNSMNTMDFNKLNKDIGSTVNSALEEVRKTMATIQAESLRSKLQQKMQPQPQPQPQPQQKTQPQKNDTSQVKQPVKMPYVSVPNVSVGKVAGTLFTVFGSIGIGLIGTAVLVLSVLGSLITAAGEFSTIVLGLLPLLGGSVLMEMKGTQIRSRLKRFRRYLSLFHGRNICSIKELSAYSGFSERFLIKDLKKMISIGMFPQAHIDGQKAFIMLNRESYQKYLTEQEGRRQLEEEQKDGQRKKAKQGKLTNHKVDKEVWGAIEDGKVYIRQIQEANEAIHDETVSKKLYRMEEVISKILDYVEDHPQQLPEIRKFMEYYLPTTLKLLNAYKEFDNQPIQGENITTAKREIQATFDTINLAFENLLDSLFENAAWDVSTDISVLETMLAQEGLMEKDFNVTK